MKKYTLSKDEKLKSRKSIGLLFSSGKVIFKYPLRVNFHIYENTPDNTQAVIIKSAFSAPKRKFKRAVDRNRIKRLMKESYRINKYDILSVVNTSRNIQIEILWTYIAEEILTLKQIDKSIKWVLEKIISDVINEYP